MRALYQRRKGRDLFDMWFAITQGNVDSNAIIKAWNFYINSPVVFFYNFLWLWINID